MLIGAGDRRKERLCLRGDRREKGTPQKIPELELM